MTIERFAGFCSVSRVIAPPSQLNLLVRRLDEWTPARRRTVGYCRTACSSSGIDQGIVRQMGSLEECAGELGIKIARGYIDQSQSGMTRGPLLGQCCDDAVSGGFDILLVEDLERLARDYLLRRQILTWLCFHGVAVVATGERVVVTVRRDGLQ